MNILVSVARTPFVPSAAGRLAETLVARLGTAKGIKAELMTLPSTATDGERMLDEAVLFGLLRTANADRMIALNFPAYVLPYPDMIVWIATPDDLPPDAGDPASARERDVARTLAAADRQAFVRASRLFGGTEALCDRIAAHGARAELLPVPDDEDEAGWAGAVARLAA